LSDGITPSRLPSLLVLCRQEELEVEVGLFEGAAIAVDQWLHDDLYDVGFAQSDEVGDGLVAEAVWSDVLMVAVSARHPLLRHKRIPLEEMLRYPLVLFAIRKSAKDMGAKWSACCIGQTWSL